MGGGDGWGWVEVGARGVAELMEHVLRSFLIPARIKYRQILQLPLVVVAVVVAVVVVAVIVGVAVVVVAVVVAVVVSGHFPSSSSAAHFQLLSATAVSSGGSQMALTAGRPESISIDHSDTLSIP